MSRRKRTARSRSKPARPKQPSSTSRTVSIVPNHHRRFDLFNLAIAAVSMVLSLAALVFAMVAFRSSERAEGPRVEVGAFHQVKITTSTRANGTTTHSDPISFDVLVLVNRGRTPLDLVRVRPVDKGGEPQAAKVIFSAEHCEREGHATIAPGAGLAVAMLPEDPNAFSGAWEVGFATGTETVRLELDRRLASSDPAGVAGSYDADAEKLLKACRMVPSS